MLVYLVTNSKTGMQYVGQTSCSLQRRWANHCPTTDHNPYFTNAIRKYGREGFSVITLHECESKAEMDFVETFYISFLNTKRPTDTTSQTVGRVVRGIQFLLKEGSG